MLSDTKVRRAQGKARPYKLSDRDGLYLFVTVTGAKSWRYNYRLVGRQQTLVIGRYPDVGLADARELHDDARKLVARGKNPAATKRERRLAQEFAAENTLRGAAEAWFAEKSAKRSESWQDNVRRWLDRDVYPALGDRPIGEVDEEDVRALMRNMAEVRVIIDKQGRRWKTGGPKTAHHTRLALAQVFDYAKRRKLVSINPAREARDEIELPEPKHHRPLSPNDIPQFLGAVDRYPGRVETRLAIRLLLLTFTRKMELLGAKWSEIAFDDPAGPTWRIPAARMKKDRPHIVPLSRQAMECFQEIRRQPNAGESIFPALGRSDGHLSASALNAAFERIGYSGRITPHGLRATASTSLNEQGYDRDAIELQLAHVEQDETRASYNHADKLPERRRMMQAWADYIDALCARSNVLPLRRVA